VNHDHPDRFSLAHRRRYRTAARLLTLMAAVLAGMTVVELVSPNSVTIPLVLFSWLAFLAIATSVLISRRDRLRRHANWLVSHTRRREYAHPGEAFAHVFFNALWLDLHEFDADDADRGALFNEHDAFLDDTGTLSAERARQIARAAIGTPLRRDVEAFLASLAVAGRS
jgi:hypothetical protein